jgi:hypothetical protein
MWDEAGVMRESSRAIVHLAWGEAFVDKAIASARSAAMLGLPRILLTNAEQAATAEKSGAFEIIRAIDAENWDHQLKSRLLEFLPSGFDSYLYLDADTIVLGDLSFGFAKAEQYGLAIAPAPKYNLTSYKGFDRAIAAANIRISPQLAYNTGVVFFSLTPEVRRLFGQWRGLCDTLGRPRNYLQDQGFFALAIEQSGFNPYVLPSVYNYRGFGEMAIGEVLVWHSRHPLPADLNAYAPTELLRRYLDGVKAPV